MNGDRVTKVVLTAEVGPYEKGFTKASTVTTKFGKDVDAVNAKSKGMESQLSKTGGALKGVAIGAGALAGTALVAFLGDSVKAAGDLQQSIGGVDAVFKDSAKTVHDFGQTSAEAVGLSRNEFNQLITVTGAMLKNKGIQDFTEQSLNLVKVGADLAAQFGGPTSQAVDALNAAMRGESDPIERYGISLSETAVNAQLAAAGVSKVGGAFTEQQKTTARLTLIMQQSADAMGAFGRESDTLQGQQQRLTAEWEDAKAELGSALLPALTSVTEALRGGLDLAVASASAWENIPGPIKAAAAALIVFHLAQKPVGAGLETVRNGIQRVRDEMALQQALASGITGGYQKLGDEAVVAGEKMSRSATVMSVGAKAAKGVGSAMLGAFGGPLGLAITGITFALGGYIQAQANARAAAEELAATLDKQTGKFTEQTRESFVKRVFGDFNQSDYARVRDSLDSAGVGVSDLIAAYEQGGPAIDTFKAKFDEWQRSARASGGPHSQLVADAERIGNAYESVGSDLENARVVFDETGKVQEKVAAGAEKAGAAAADAGPKVKTYVDATNELRTAGEKARKSQQDLAQSILDVSDAAVTADQAEAGWQKAIDDATKSIDDNGKAVTLHGKRVKDNGDALNLNSEAGRANQEALVGLRDAALKNAEAMLNQGDGIGIVKTKMDAAREAFITTATKMGLNDKAAADLATQYGITTGSVDTLKASMDKIPKEVKSKTTVDTISAMANLAALQVQLALIKSKRIRVTTDFVTTGDVSLQAARNRSAIEDLRQADGGPVPGFSPHERADNIPIMATADEYMIRRSSARKLGRATLDYINATGSLPAQRLADGGFVSRMPARAVPSPAVPQLVAAGPTFNAYGLDARDAVGKAWRDYQWDLRKP